VISIPWAANRSALEFKLNSNSDFHSIRGSFCFDGQSTRRREHPAVGVADAREEEEGLTAEPQRCLLCGQPNWIIFYDATSRATQNPIPLL